MDPSLPPEVSKQTPARAPPLGIESNLVDPVTKMHTLIVVYTILLTLGLAAFSTRLYAKVFITKKSSWSDLALSISLLGVIATYVGNVLGSVNGYWGKHIWDVSVYSLTCKSAAIYNYINTISRLPALGLLKFSVLLMYLEIFWPLRWLRIAVYIGTVVTLVAYGALAVFEVVVSTPRSSSSWSQWPQTPTFARGQEASLPTGIIGLITDAYLLILPVYAVAGVQLPIKQKVGAICCFATGILACVASMLSIYYRVRLNKFRAIDFTWEGPNMLIVSQFEMSAGVIIASAPAIKQTYRHHAPAIYKTWSSLTSRLYLSRLNSQEPEAKNKSKS